MPLITFLKSAECGALFKDTGPPGRTANSATVENPSRLLPVMAIAQTNVRYRVKAGSDRTMSAWFFIIGLVLLWAGVSSRLARRERRSLELAALNYPIKVAAFWGHDAKAERQAYFDKFEEHKNWRNNIKFQLTNWTTFGIGATLCLVGTVLWLGDDPTRTWDRLWDLVGPFVIAVAGIYYVYQLMKRLDKTESEIRSLNLMLEQVKDNGQVHYSELERRLDKLEEK
jgi:hypothetical protein